MQAVITIVLLGVAGSFVTLDARADIYKCEEADGSLVYSQTPCSQDEPVTVRTAASDNSEADCSYAGKFAVATAKTMRHGISSNELFDRYGGLDALSRGSMGVINYVYSFRTNRDVTADRIAGLAQAKCKAKSFGDVSCEALPLSFTEELGGCDAGQDEKQHAPAATKQTAKSLGRPGKQISASNERAIGQSAAASEEEFTQACKKRYRDQIDAIDAQMRSGYSSQQGENYREQLRALTEKMRAC